MSKCLIWCVERGQWWKSENTGYTSNIDEAGRYEEEDAKKILKAANFNPDAPLNEIALEIKFNQK